jgi:hypothetical protein
MGDVFVSECVVRRPATLRSASESPGLRLSGHRFRSANSAEVVSKVAETSEIALSQAVQRAIFEFSTQIAPRERHRARRSDTHALNFLEELLR